jgi:predicted regulator of Ras-like GTPase activity (Roadblock/LC7/MglB family)
MTTGLDADIVGANAAAERRDEVVAAVTDHAGRVARELARLEGGDYGQVTIETEAGSWTLKYEAGDVQYLRFEGGRTETYVVSTQQPPDPAALADALEDYDAFVAGFNDYVRSKEGVLDDVSIDFPSVASADDAVAERERVCDRLRETCDAMAAQLHRCASDNYGAFTARVGGTRWELKWEEGRARYLRVGGEGGVYLLSEYQPPPPRDLRTHVDDFSGFVEAFNEHVTEVSESLETVEL